jgi:hypothetical protein
MQHYSDFFTVSVVWKSYALVARTGSTRLPFGLSKLVGRNREVTVTIPAAYSGKSGFKFQWGDPSFSWFFSVPPGTYWDNALNWVTTTSTFSN